MENLSLMLRLDQRVDELAGLTFMHYGIEVKRPTVKFDLRGLAAGCMHCYENVMSLNPILLFENPDEFIDKTVGHEWSHLATRRIHPKASWNHGRQWQSIMRTLHIPIEIDHRYNVSTILGKTPHIVERARGERVDRIAHEKELVIYQNYVAQIRGI